MSVLTKVSRGGLLRLVLLLAIFGTLLFLLTSTGQARVPQGSSFPGDSRLPICACPGP